MKLIDLTNERFGKLVVLHRLPSINGQTQWQCRCDCGNEKRVQAVHLKSGHTQSCGCSHYTYGETHKSWKGHKEISSRFFKSIVYNAKARNLTVTLTIQEIWDLFLKQNRQCALSGLPLVFSANHGRVQGTASLDRIDSTKGYVKGNVQWVHVTVNNMKWDVPQDQFLSMCRLITKHNRLCL